MYIIILKNTEKNLDFFDKIKVSIFKIHFYSQKSGDKSKNKYISGFKTNSKHIDIPSNNSSAPYTIKRDMSVSTREDGNNVNADVEAANQVKNTVNYNAVVQRISSNFQTLKTAIRGGS